MPVPRASQGYFTAHIHGNRKPTVRKKKARRKALYRHSRYLCARAQSPLSRSPNMRSNENSSGVATALLLLLPTGFALMLALFYIVLPEATCSPNDGGCLALAWAAWIVGCYAFAGVAMALRINRSIFRNPSRDVGATISASRRIRFIH